jgi:hypothetical protein
MAKSANSFLKPSMNWLLVFIPFTLFMEHAMPDRPVLVFSARLRLFRLQFIVQATEDCNTHRDAIGGLLNATFGNARADHLLRRPKVGFDMVVPRAGALLANLLALVWPSSWGTRYHTREFNPVLWDAGEHDDARQINMMVPGGIIPCDRGDPPLRRYLNIGCHRPPVSTP